MKSRPWILVLSLALIAGPPALVLADDARQERAFELIRKAKRHIRDSRKEGMDKFKENEKAIIYLEEAAKLLEKEVEADPENQSMLEVLQDTAAMLFWCHKMAPISMERKEAFNKKIKEEDAKIEEEAKKEGATSKEDVVKVLESKASLAYESARDYEKAARNGKEDRRFEIMTRYFQIADRYSATRVAIQANKESLRMQREIFAGNSAQIKEKAQGDFGKLKKIVSTYASARKKLLCSECDGRIKIPCKVCKGQGWKFRRYGTGRVDWPLSKACRRCNPTGLPPMGSPEPRNGPNAGVQICKKTYCTYGLNYRHMRTLFWEMVDRPEFNRRQVKLKKMPEQAFLETLAAVMNPLTDEETLEVALTKASRFVVLDKELLLESMKEIAKIHDHTLKPFNAVKKKLEKSGRVKLTFKVYKPKSAFDEEIIFVWENDEWWVKQAG